MSIKISAVVHTYNESRNIEACLLSLIEWTDEIIVIDMYSTDNTVVICKKHTDKVFLHENLGYADPARRFGLSQATGDWIICIDADERIPFQLSQSLKKITSEDQFDVIFLPMKNFIFGKWIKHAGWFPGYHPRFFRKGFVCPKSQVHSGFEVKGRVHYLDYNNESNCIVHFNYRIVSEFIEKMNRYTSFEIEKLKKKPTRLRFIKAFFYEFKRRFLTQKGYKDGMHGFVLSLLMGTYKMLAYIKKWEFENFGAARVDSTYKRIENECIKTGKEE